MKIFKRLLLWFGILIFGIFLSFLLIKGGERPSIPILGSAPDFTLYDTSAEEFSAEELAGKTWVVNFMFTTCGSICPLMSKNIASVYQAYLSQKDVHFVSISVNPEYDSPSVLAEYAKKYRADIKRWHFLTGARSKITDLLNNGFKLGSAEDIAMHSGYFVLVDSKGFIRGYYDGTNQAAIHKLLKDIAILRLERKP